MSDSDRPRIVDSEAGGSRIADDGESFRRLVTPGIVCDFRAAQVSISRIPEGFVLDPAAGSGGQLAAYGKRLGKSCVGVELSPRRAVHCANSLSTLGGDVDTLAICGDGLDSEGVMSLVREKMRDVKISMLHVDPARPLDAQNHSISEMEPPLRPLLEAWSDYLESGELGVSLLLDLSPRLAPKQRMEVEAIVRDLFPGVNLTWEWLSRGGGRVDRLTVHTGGLAQEDGGVRCVRLHRDGSFDALSGKAGDYHAEWVDIDPVVGEILALVDPVVTQSGLRIAYEKGAGQEGRVKWVHDSDRRPMAIL
ncbi:MAG: class I SAM-dependent methyltransferase, partial [Candidatus Thermoplasmatota archaeon]|nr:class I SAM-dependent methyltransferase [Candidatus Thermoplasmatota archaeon]